jgi:hypothetical protein
MKDIMKLTDRIKLNTSTHADDEGNPKPDVRTVEQEIQRLRNTGMHEAADRMEGEVEGESKATVKARR